MARATVCFNIEGDAAAIDFHGQHPNDFPADAINKALEVLYKNDDLAPYCYVVYNGDQWLGLLVAGNFSPESDDEIRPIWGGIISQNAVAPLTGVLSPIAIDA